MSELLPDEPSIATAGAARSAKLARVGTDPVDERRRAFNRDRKRRASANCFLMPAATRLRTRGRISRDQSPGESWAPNPWFGVRKGRSADTDRR
jgi:hypothetical protein